jgi:hypothetical protein
MYNLGSAIAVIFEKYFLSIFRRERKIYVLITVWFKQRLYNCFQCVYDNYTVISKIGWSQDNIVKWSYKITKIRRSIKWVEDECRAPLPTIFLLYCGVVCIVGENYWLLHYYWQPLSSYDGCITPGRGLLHNPNLQVKGTDYTIRQRSQTTPYTSPKCKCILYVESFWSVFFLNSGTYRLFKVFL